VAGFNVTSAGVGLLEPLVAIVEAAVGANPPILALDLAWDRQVRDRFAATKVKETVEASTSIG